MSSSSSSLQAAATSLSTGISDATPGVKRSSLASVSRGGGGGGRWSGRSNDRGGRSFTGRGRGRGRKNSSFSHGYEKDGLMPVCRFFRRGYCTAGTNCRFRHTQEAASEATQIRQYQSSPTDFNSYWHSTQDEVTPSESKPKGPQKRSSLREFDPYKAEAISLAKCAQDVESRPFADVIGPFYSIDIECVAVGFGHSDKQRYPGRIAMLKDNSDDEENQLLVDEIVNLKDKEREIASYMTELTGLSPEKSLSPDATKPLQEIRNLIKQKLPKDAVLVGQSIQHDIEWLGLVKGEDFRDYVDTCTIFRQRIPKNLGSAANALRKSQEDRNLKIKADAEAAARAAAAEEDIKLKTVGNSDDFAKDMEQSLPDLEKEGHGDVCLNADADGEGQKEEELGVDQGTKGIKPEKDESSSEGFTTDEDESEANDSLIPFPTRYRIFSLRHCCINLLGVDIQAAAHDPVKDAQYSLLLFHQYRQSPPEMLRAVRDSLHRAPVTPSFASEHPLVEGVCLSLAAYRFKWAGRFIWSWWLAVKKIKRESVGHDNTSVDPQDAS